jgi:hypothetical protein
VHRIDLKAIFAREAEEDPQATLAEQKAKAVQDVHTHILSLSISFNSLSENLFSVSCSRHQ